MLPKRVYWPYKPQPKQVKAHACCANEMLYGGAAGGGKSYWIIHDAALRCLRYPKTDAYLFRRTFPELEHTLIKLAKSCIPKEVGHYVGGRHQVIFENGSTMNFAHLTDEATIYNYQGTEIQWLYFDELTHFTKEMYEYLLTRNRASTTLGVTPVTRSASNPGGPGHGWVKSRFVDSTDVGKHRHVIKVYDPEDKTWQRSTVEYIPATIKDNQYITKDYRIELLKKPENLRNALLYGKWDAFEGQAFPEFRDDRRHYHDRKWTHVIAPFEIPWNWTRYVSFDHGYSRPFSFGAWAVDTEGRVYRYKELYGCVEGEPNTGIKKTPGEIAHMLEDFLADEYREGIHVNGIADPAIWDRSRGTSVEEQIRSVFSGVSFLKGDNTRLPGKMQFHERLKFDEDGHPMMYIFSNCRDFIRTIPTLSYSLKKPEDIDTDGEDHIYDESRYFLMSRPILARIPHEPPEPILYNPFD